MRQKREYGKKPSPPKKALSSFLLFRAEVFDRVKAMNPGLRITELTMIISEMWNNADSQIKYRLQQEHEKNKIITAFQKQQYQKMYGHVEKKKRHRRKKKQIMQARKYGYHYGV